MSLRGIVSRKGASVTFTLTTSTIDPATDLSTSPVTTTVTGKAMQIDGDPDLLKEKELIESENPTLLFVPDTLGQLPAFGASVTWGGDSYVVKNRKPLAMSGTASAAMVVVGK